MGAPGAHRGLRRTPLAHPSRLVLGPGLGTTATSAGDLACWGRGLRVSIRCNFVYAQAIGAAPLRSPLSARRPPLIRQCLPASHTRLAIVDCRLNSQPEDPARDPRRTRTRTRTRTRSRPMSYVLCLMYVCSV
jgi:hypothetical protein